MKNCTCAVPFEGCNCLPGIYGWRHPASITQTTVHSNTKLHDTSTTLPMLGHSWTTTAQPAAADTLHHVATGLHAHNQTTGGSTSPALNLNPQMAAPCPTLALAQHNPPTRPAQPPNTSQQQKETCIPHHLRHCRPIPQLNTWQRLQGTCTSCRPAPVALPAPGNCQPPTPARPS